MIWPKNSIAAVPPSANHQSFKWPATGSFPAALIASGETGTRSFSQDPTRPTRLVLRQMDEDVFCLDRDVVTGQRGGRWPAADPAFVVEHSHVTRAQESALLGCQCTRHPRCVQTS